MDSKTLRKKFLDFFKNNGHVILPSAPLVPSDKEQLTGKEKVLFTSAGMQPLIPYLMGKPHPQGKRLANIQKCVRTDDIEEVGDGTHHTFFEMLGNWSLGAYWKDESIEMSFRFLTAELGISKERLAVSVFTGDEDAPRDEESANKWKNLGISEKRIAYLGKEDNWWPTSRRDPITGELKNAFGPCGSDTEIFYWIPDSNAPEEFNPEDKRWVEIWNNVFMEFNRQADGTLEELPQKNVDTGMGFERTLAVINGKQNNYETDIFEPIINEIKKSKNSYSERSQRIIADHLRAVVFLIADGVKPDPKDSRGSVVHRLITLALYQENRQLEQETVNLIVDAVITKYKDTYTEVDENRLGSIHQEINNVVGSLSLLVKGPVYKQMSEKLVEALKSADPNVDASETISFYHQSMGIPEPVAFGAAQEMGLNLEEIKPIYEQKRKEHQSKSKGVEAGKFKGGLESHGDNEIKYHTTTHLLHQALRDVLGPDVFQKGSNITSERLRFDFSFDRKMTEEEIKKVEDIINEKIEQDLKVDHMIVPIEKAQEMNAIGLFNDKYATEVSVYGVGQGSVLDPHAKDQRDRGGYYSLEFCGGPHVAHTGAIGRIKITKEEAVSAGMRRIRAELVAE